LSLKRLVLLGVGNTAHAVNRSAFSYDTKYGTTRSAENIERLESSGITPLLLDGSKQSLEALHNVSSDSHVVVSFPPSAPDDAVLSQTVNNAAKIVYVSSTGVYGGASGVIDESTAVDAGNPMIEPRLAAETVWRNAGAVVLRAPALYGPNYGLHLSLLSGKYKMPGDGRRFSSRIHLDDFAAIILKALELAAPGSTYVVGDQRPATHLEVVTWLCERLGIDMPESIPLENAHVTLRGNRQICADKVLTDLNINLKYPDFKTGFEQCLDAKS